MSVNSYSDQANRNIRDRDPDRRVYWRCRRGMLELDILLQEFYQKNFNRLSLPDRQVFVRLLEYPDNLLFELLLGGSVSTDEEINRVIKQIRTVTTH